MKTEISSKDYTGIISALKLLGNSNEYYLGAVYEIELLRHSAIETGCETAFVQALEHGQELISRTVF